MSCHNAKCRIYPTCKGPFLTGCYDLMIGKTREDVLMRIFYPTAKNLITNECLTDWSLGSHYSYGMARGVTRAMGSWGSPRVTSWIQTLVEYSRAAVIPAYYSAPPIQNTPELPVIVLSHGMHSNRTFYSLICNELASHGFLVAALEHRDGSANCSFFVSDNDEIEWVEHRFIQENESELEIRKNQVKIRAKDCSNALDALQMLNEGRVKRNDFPDTLKQMGECKNKINLSLEKFVGRLNLSRPILAGHSFGAATALLCMGSDKRYKLGIILDAWMFSIKDEFKSLSKNIEVPLLFINSEKFMGQKNFNAYVPFEKSGAQFFALKKLTHLGQSDSFFMFHWFLSFIVGMWQYLDKELAIRINNDLILAFIRDHLGIPESFEESSENVKEKHKDWLYVGLLEHAKFRFGVDSLDDVIKSSI